MPKGARLKGQLCDKPDPPLPGGSAASGRGDLQAVAALSGGGDAFSEQFASFKEGNLHCLSPVVKLELSRER